MGILHKTILALTIISVYITLVQCQRRRVKVNPLAAMLKNILSPSNPDGAMQLLNLAAAGARNCGNPYSTEEIIIPAGPKPYPRGYPVVPKGYPNIPVTQNLPLLEVVQPVIETMQPIVEVPRGYPKYQPVPCGPVQYQSPPVPNCGCQPVMQERCPCNPSPAPLVNPYLPAASPVSALAPPTSSMLPPANINQCRCNFLRKIPIPPPTI